MVFSSEKKELWRYASRNNVNCSVGVGNNRPQQLLRHQHLHRLQSPPPDYYATTTRKLIQQQEPQLQLPPEAAAAVGAGATTTTRRNITTVNTTCLTDDNRLNQQQLQQQQQLEEHNMPPPPYSSVPCGIDCSDTCQQRRRRLSTTSSNCGNYDGGGQEEMDGGGSGSISGSGSVDRYSIGGISYIDGKSAFTCASVSSSRSISSLGKNKNNNNNNMERNEHDWKLYKNNNNNYDNEENAIVVATNPTTTRTCTTTTTPTTSSASTSTTIPIVTSTASVLAATAASIFRNCCGGSIGGGDGILENANQSSNSLTITSTTSNNSNNNKHSILLAKNCNTTTACFTRRQYFDAFMKHLKEGQVTVLLKAVKSRLDPISSLTALYQQRKQQQQHHQNHQQHQQYAPYCCILVHRALIMNEELHVIVCRLFFWPELKDASELKSLPDCPNHCDPMYICCNPLHWCRIFKAETAPPPYQLNSNTCDKMQYNDTTILENGRSQNIENNVPPTRQNYLLANENIVQNLCVQIPESVATAGEDAQACSLIWCQLAYWELRQRVGPLYMAKKSCVNVYTDTPQHDALSEGMCLKDLSAINTSNIRNDSVSEDVQYTRKKIGLGVTLSQEADGVWLYNRSRVPIFLHSPTLSESWFRVCKISPGECVKAFDTHRAHSLYTLPYDGSHMGRVDTFSMRLSFAKGWGCNYKRQDITRCPCWLEVFFTQR